jgi:hypothetical protein
MPDGIHESVSAVVDACAITRARDRLLGAESTRARAHDYVHGEPDFTEQAITCRACAVWKLLSASAIAALCSSGNCYCTDLGRIALGKITARISPTRTF